MSEEQQMKFELFTAKSVRENLVNPLIAGFAIYSSSEQDYKISLMMYPGFFYYMKKNQEAGYTVYSKRVREKETFKYLNPVGKARISLHLKEYIEIFFPFTRSRVFLSLHSKSL